MYCGTGESFGKQWQVGDVVGVFLDLLDRTISKYRITCLNSANVNQYVLVPFKKVSPSTASC